MFIERNPWVVVVACILVASGVYFTVVTINHVNRSDLLGSWFLYAIVFVSFATIALAVYRSMRRSHDPAAMDEAKAERGH
jgi:TRAP-type C4-dicarboxylate transport system permease small subunit